MQKKPSIINEGEGNLRTLFYGYAKGVEKSLDDIGKRFLELIEEEFNSHGTDWGPWQKLSEVTIEWKGGNIPLQATGSTSESFRYEKLSKTLLWVGSNSPIAIIHEFGVYIKITDAIRGIFAARGFPLRPEKNFIKIPERPILRPVLEKLKNEMGDIVIKDINANIHIRPV